VTQQQRDQAVLAAGSKQSIEPIHAKMREAASLGSSTTPSRPRGGHRSSSANAVSCKAMARTLAAIRQRCWHYA
jgi:hypothetical protein